MKERTLGPHELRERLSAAGIKAVLFDFDDTLIDTNELFGKRMRLFVHSVVEKRGDLDWRQTWENLGRINTAFVRKRSVLQDNLPKTAEVLGRLNNARRLFKDRSDLLTHIYREAPNLFDGAVTLLDAFYDAGIPIGLVTHAGKEWTAIKIDSLNLRKYFSVVQIANISRPKSAEDWREAIEKMGFKPEEVLVIGDNLKGDIIAARSVGVKHTILVESPWDFYREGEIPKEVIEVKGITEIPSVIMNMT